MSEEEAASIEEQFYEFARLFEPKTRNGETINLYRSDYWMRQAKLLDDREVTMTDTGILFYNRSQTELTLGEWLEFISELCVLKDLNADQVKEALTNCGMPGTTVVTVPAYREFFLTYKPKGQLVL